VENVVIIGSGPAGYTAAIYAGRANLRPLVFEGMSRGGVPGGQLMTTTEVENFPGFPEGITGPDLMDRMSKQAERWGAQMLQEDVEVVDTTVRPFRIKSTEREVLAHSIIVATGATAKRLNLPSEHIFWSRGISACAICDGASPIFKGQELGVVGGGDSATEEAIYLTKYGKHVHLFVRGDHMKASKAMQDRVLGNKGVTVHFNAIPLDVYPDMRGKMAGLIIKDSVTGEESKVPLKGLFYGIGHNPNSDLFLGQLELNSSGYLVVEEGTKTSTPGIFSAGDVHDTEWRQAVTAAGSGCMAAISVERYLTAENLMMEFHQEEPVKTETSRSTSMTSTLEVEDSSSFDALATFHKGQFALRKLYHESDRLVTVLYSGPNCGPCRRLKPMLFKVLEDFEDKMHYIEIDIEDDPEIAQAAGVMGTPRVDFFYKKERLTSLNGVKMKSEYRRIIEENMAKQMSNKTVKVANKV